MFFQILQVQQMVTNKYNCTPVSSQGSNTSRCFNCQGIGHKMSECLSSKQNSTSKKVNVVEKDNFDELYVETTKEDLEAKEHLEKAALGIMQATKDGAIDSHVQCQQILMIYNVKLSISRGCLIKFSAGKFSDVLFCH